MSAPAGFTGVRSIGDVIAGRERRADGRRTFQPVRRSSFHVDDRRAKVFRPVARSRSDTRKFFGSLLRVAEQFDDEGKLPGKVNGHLGHVALRILREMGRKIHWQTGQLDPSLETLMALTKRSKAAVVAALARLRLHGFLDWVRRTEPIEDPDPFGPQVRQVSNAYWFDMTRLPRKAGELLRRLLGRDAPAPDDASWSRAEDRAATETMETSDPSTPRGEISLALARLGAALDRANASSRNGQNPGQKIKDDVETGG